jgi:hypothetical protein
MSTIVQQKSASNEKKDWRDYTCTELCYPEDDRERILYWNPSYVDTTMRAMPTIDIAIAEDISPTKNGDIIKQTLHTGHGALAKYGNIVTIEYTAWFADSGVEFDSTLIRLGVVTHKQSNNSYFKW